MTVRSLYALFEHFRRLAEKTLKEADATQRKRIDSARIVLYAAQVMRCTIEQIEADTERYCRFATPGECQNAAEWMFKVIELRHGTAAARKIFNNLGAPRRKTLTNRMLRGLTEDPLAGQLLASIENIAAKIVLAPELLEALELPRTTSKDTLRKRLKRVQQKR
jgi:hypothetical protein